MIDLEAVEARAKVCERADCDEDEASEAVSDILDALPALVAEVRELRTQLSAAEDRAMQTHNEVRRGYDKVIADSWRAEVARRDAQVEALTKAGQARARGLVCLLALRHGAQLRPRDEDMQRRVAEDPAAQRDRGLRPGWRVQAFSGL